jgi:UDP-hydrolysing UDP-N-acetyl-D-glucosamine 2-epimerase
VTKRKIAVVTGTRAEYGLLAPIIRLVHEDPALDLQLIVTGTHLSARHGMTVREIERDGFPIRARVPLPLSRDDSRGVGEALAEAVGGLSEAFARLKPDLLVLLGDRYETLAAATAALAHRLPVAHLHGGEATEGVWDESARHAITKLSHLHFTAAPAYAARVRSLGEDPRRVYCFGSPGLDRIREVPRLTRAALEKDLGLPLRAPVGIVTVHPETLASDAGEATARAVAAAIKKVPGTWIVTAPNADLGGMRLRKALEAAGTMFDSLGQSRYFSLLQLADVMVGNSSSGLLEAPYFGVPTVNAGDRQKGRLRGPSVIDVPKAAPAAVLRALRRALTPAFRAKARRLAPKASAAPSRKIVSILKNVPLGEALLKKRLHGR